MGWYVSHEVNADILAAYLLAFLRPTTQPFPLFPNHVDPSRPESSQDDRAASASTHQVYTLKDIHAIPLLPDLAEKSVRYLSKLEVGFWPDAWDRANKTRTNVDHEDARTRCVAGRHGIYSEEYEDQDQSHRRKPKENPLRKNLPTKKRAMTNTYHPQPQKRMRRPSRNLHLQKRSPIPEKDSVEDGVVSCRDQAKKPRHQHPPSSRNPNILVHLLLKSSTKHPRLNQPMQLLHPLLSLPTHLSVASSRPKSSSKSSPSSRPERSFTASTLTSRTAYSTRDN